MSILAIGVIAGVHVAVNSFTLKAFLEVRQARGFSLTNHMTGANNAQSTHLRLGLSVFDVQIKLAPDHAASHNSLRPLT